MVSNFFLENFDCVTAQVIAACLDAELDADDMVMEIDFMPDKDGLVPALQSPPRIKVAPFACYVDGSEQPEWLCEARYARAYEELSERVFEDLEKCASTNADTGSALIVRFPDGGWWVHDTPM